MVWMEVMGVIEKVDVLIEWYLFVVVVLKFKWKSMDMWGFYLFYVYNRVDFWEVGRCESYF